MRVWNPRKYASDADFRRTLSPPDLSSRPLKPFRLLACASGLVCLGMGIWKLWLLAIVLIYAAYENLGYVWDGVR